MIVVTEYQFAGIFTGPKLCQEIRTREEKCKPREYITSFSTIWTAIEYLAIIIRLDRMIGAFQTWWNYFVCTKLQCVYLLCETNTIGNMDGFFCSSIQMPQHSFLTWESKLSYAWEALRDKSGTIQCSEMCPTHRAPLFLASRLMIYLLNFLAIRFYSQQFPFWLSYRQQIKHMCNFCKWLTAILFLFNAFVYIICPICGKNNVRVICLMRGAAAYSTEH